MKKELCSHLIIRGNQEETEKDVLTAEEFELMMKKAKNERDRLLFTILWYTGIRREAVVSLKISYIN